MDEIIIEKLEKEDKKLASIYSRIIAYFIDNVICYILILGIFVFFQTPELSEELKLAVTNEDYERLYALITDFVVYFVIIRFSYLFLFFYLYGATFGNMLTKTKIINFEHFDKPDLFASFVRVFVFIICDIFLNGVLFLSIFINKTRRHFADTLSKSVVIKVD